MIIGLILGFLKIFENSKPNVEYLVLVALLVAVCVMGMLPTAAVPGVQAASFVIIMAGIIFGRETGFITGVLTVFVMSLFLGFGFWSVFQMIGWGLMGFTAGLFSSKLENVYLRASFGFIWGFAYGWITDISMLPFLSTVNLNSIIGVFIASAPFDLLHGTINAILLVLLYGLFKKIFSRVKNKFIFSMNVEKNITANHGDKQL
nr:ECF transporter S component [Methanobacterium alcaliphilum]